MTSLFIDAGFDSGNIDVLGIDGATARLAIRRDNESEFFQWFHFRVSAKAGEEVVLKLTGLNASAYPGGWPDYRCVASYDRRNWFRISGTRYENGEVKPGAISVIISGNRARAAMERHFANSVGERLRDAR